MSNNESKTTLKKRLLVITFMLIAMIAAGAWVWE